MRTKFKLLLRFIFQSKNLKRIVKKELINQRIFIIHESRNVYLSSLLFSRNFRKKNNYFWKKFRVYIPFHPSIVRSIPNSK